MCSLRRQDPSSQPTGHRARTLLWSTFGDGAVQLDGRQHADGRVEAAVSICVGDAQALDATQARQLAAALLDAAGARDALAGIVGGRV